MTLLVLFGASIGMGADGAQEEPVTIDVWGLVEARLHHGTFEAIREFERRHEGRIRVNVGTPVSSTRPP